jgi:intracellular septation protein
VIVFFTAYRLADIYVATATAIVATFFQVGWLKLKRRRVSPMLWTSFGLITVFGGATLIFHDETFIKWKPTVLYWLFALVMVGSQLLFRRNLIRVLLQSELQLELPDHVWGKLIWMWSLFFAFMGALNLYVALSFTLDSWVTFRTFVLTGLFAVFMVAQVLFLARYIDQEQQGNKP